VTATVPTPRPAIRDAGSADFPAILRLNAEWVHFTSALDEDALTRLHAQSPYHRVAVLDGAVAAFLLALREGCDYGSPNYRWFDDRGGRFLYVDRVIVNTASQGRGLARLLYDDLLAFARKSGVDRIVCELDVEPPNLPSARFHDGYGFREVGTQLVSGGTKRVSLRELILA
jgi:predicted GNAT superfamily acetyltransferase